MKKNKKILILIMSYLIIFFNSKTKAGEYTEKINYNKEFIIDTNPLYGTYSNGNIIIISDEKYIIEKNNDLYIIDNRNTSDPNIKIYNSYKVTSLDEMKEILQMLINYENNYPSNWNRTLESMKNEWYIHNLFYKMHINEESARTVDLNNDDQNFYQSKILTKVISKK